MILKKLSGGWYITIPQTENNSEFLYLIPIAPDGPERIREAQTKIARRMTIRAFAMENFFKTLPKDWDGYWSENKESPFRKWEIKNRQYWNDYFHTEMSKMSEEAWALWREYKDWHFAKYGWNAY